MTENQPSQTSMSLAQKLVVALADILIVAAVARGMYVAGQHPDDFTPAFMKTFLPLALPTLLAALLAVRLLRPKAESALDLGRAPE